MILSASILSLLTTQYGHEMANSIAYTLLQSWAEMRGLDGAAGFFRKQAVDERGHADMVLGYIHDRNEQLSAFSMSMPDLAITDYKSLFDAALMIERATTEAIGVIKKQAESEGDHATCAWLYQPGGLIIEQIEEENTIQTILDRIESRADIGTGEATHDIDCWIAKVYA